jgi:hypothetical protein
MFLLVPIRKAEVKFNQAELLLPLLTKELPASEGAEKPKLMLPLFSISKRASEGKVTSTLVGVVCV